MSDPPIHETPEWQELVDHFGAIRGVHLRDLFVTDPTRGARMALEFDGLYLDYSKNRLTAETIRKLCALASRAGLPATPRGLSQALPRVAGILVARKRDAQGDRVLTITPTFDTSTKTARN